MSEMKSSSQDEPRQVGNYVLGITLGQGSFGKVKLATNVKTADTVAIKIVEKGSIADVEDVERVYRETFILTTLKHVNIIRLHEVAKVFSTSKAIMLAMEYADGGDLLEYVNQQKRLNEMDSCRMFQQIVSGVEYCHRAKIIHRDLKLENILLDKNKTVVLFAIQVKIAEFGLSNSIKISQNMDTNCGTPSYTPPEQITGKAAGAPADLWAMGVILFSMLCGFLPFESDSVPKLFRKIKHRQFKIPSFVSPEAASLLDRLLTVDPGKRCNISEIRNHPWFLMEYTDLCETIQARELANPISAEDVAAAREECLNAPETYHELKKAEGHRGRAGSSKKNGGIPGGNRDVRRVVTGRSMGTGPQVKLRHDRARSMGRVAGVDFKRNKMSPGASKYDKNGHEKNSSGKGRRGPHGARFNLASRGGKSRGFSGRRNKLSSPEVLHHRGHSNLGPNVHFPPILPLL